MDYIERLFIEVFRVVFLFGEKVVYGFIIYMYNVNYGLFRIKDFFYEFFVIFFFF